ncbi:hypothetical protein G6045_33550 [Streptomyces sp. YC504]|uniref:Toxin-antitoxin system HicB family antitoxin n=1 Tax=Streptomyces mesophilus TaxID=1775132 RepID=A0A6G4XUR6_9ACTN|nr:hypothetical protein [Streptomyces mesophilus]NGO80547.1 hypothetical protein [Streptomyces mesophilus]
MDLTPYVDTLRQELATAADAAGPEARDLAERLSAPLESATRLTLLHALSAAMDEVTRELAPGSVDVRLRGLDPEFVVTAPPASEPSPQPSAPPQAPLPPAPPVAPEADDGSMARINFRLPAHLKTRVEEAAARDSLSVNAWLVRAASQAISPSPRQEQPAAHHSRGAGQGFTGWVG